MHWSLERDVVGVVLQWVSVLLLYHRVVFLLYYLVVFRSFCSSSYLDVFVCIYFIIWLACVGVASSSVVASSSFRGCASMVPCTSSVDVSVPVAGELRIHLLFFVIYIGY
jgi:hypothetical protein